LLLFGFACIVQNVELFHEKNHKVLLVLIGVSSYMCPSMNIGFSAQNNNHASLDSTGSSKQTLLPSGRHALYARSGTSGLSRAASHIQQELLMNMPSSSSSFLPMIAQEVLVARDFVPYQPNGLRLTDRGGLLGGAGGGKAKARLVGGGESSSAESKAYVQGLLGKQRAIEDSMAKLRGELDSNRELVEEARLAGDSRKLSRFGGVIGGKTRALHQKQEELVAVQRELKQFLDLNLE
jgi:hypothetical protein